MTEFVFPITRYGGELDGLDFKAFVSVEPNGLTEAKAYDGNGKQVWLTQAEIVGIRNRIAEINEELKP